MTSSAKTACTASEWVVTTGTLTHVAETLRSGIPRIFLDSLRTLSSSDDQPPSLREPAHGTTFIANGAGNGESLPSLSSISRRTSPDRVPSSRLPPTTCSSSCSRSMPG